MLSNVESLPRGPEIELLHPGSFNKSLWRLRPFPWMFYDLFEEPCKDAYGHVCKVQSQRLPAVCSALNPRCGLPAAILHKRRYITLIEAAWLNSWMPKSGILRLAKPVQSCCDLAGVSGLGKKQCFLSMVTDTRADAAATAPDHPTPCTKRGPGRTGRTLRACPFRVLYACFTRHQHRAQGWNPLLHP